MNKTTSTGIEELRKEFMEKFGSNCIPAVFIWEWVAPHLSNKSELKKEAVREFMEFCWDGGEHDGWIIAKADEYFSSNEKEEGEKQ